MSGSELVGAFFDLDGTLLDGPSLEWRFIWYLLAQREIAPRNASRWLAYALSKAVKGSRDAIWGNKFYLSRLRESLAADWDKSLETRKNALPGLKFSTAALETIQWHLARQHRVFVVSGTPEPLAWVAKRRIGLDIGICATQLEVSMGRWTGKLVGPHMTGLAKARAVHSLAEQHGLALSRSYAYGNSIFDAPMLEAVANPRAVNASPGLVHFARSRGWQMCVWRDAHMTVESPAKPISIAREEVP